MALGLNIVVGFAGLLDLGYVAFFAIGAYTMGWFGLGLLLDGQRREGHPHPRQRASPPSCPGIHFNFLLILVARGDRRRAIAGMIIGLPTLRLRGDYIAIVTLAFGEIIGRFAVNGDDDRSSASALQPHRTAARASRRSTRSTCRSSSRSPALEPATLVLDRARAGRWSCCS